MHWSWQDCFIRNLLRIWENLLQYHSERFLLCCALCLGFKPLRGKTRFPLRPLPAPSFVYTFPFLQCCSSLPSWDACPPSTCTHHIQRKHQLLYPLQVNTALQQHGRDKLTLTTPAILSPCNGIVRLVGCRAVMHEVTQKIFMRRILKLPVVRASSICRQLNLCGPCAGLLPQFSPRLCAENGRLLGKTGFDGFWCISVATQGSFITCSLYKHQVKHVYFFSTLET